MKREMNIYIIELLKYEFTTKETGELISMCQIKYGVKTDPTDDHAGLDIRKASMSSSMFERFKNETMKPIKAVFVERPTERGYNLALQSLNGIDVRINRNQ